jgi:hypothetical protein
VVDNCDKFQTNPGCYFVHVIPKFITCYYIQLFNFKSCDVCIDEYMVGQNISYAYCKLSFLVFLSKCISKGVIKEMCVFVLPWWE